MGRGRRGAAAATADFWATLKGCQLRDSRWCYDRRIKPHTPYENAVCDTVRQNTVTAKSSPERCGKDAIKM